MKEKIKQILAYLLVIFTALVSLVIIALEIIALVKYVFE